MVVVSPGPATLDWRILSLYCTRDPCLGSLPVLIFYGPSTTTNSTQNSSRIQAHIFSIAGFQSFPRLTISPTSPLYTAVHQLSPEEQGDEVCRGLAICLLKYFSEIPQPVKDYVKKNLADTRQVKREYAVFDSRHAAELASRMVEVENAQKVATHLLTGLAQRCVSWIDIDFVMPRGTIAKVPITDLNEGLNDSHGNGPTVDYGIFTSVIEAFGAPSFLPTSKLRRAPSKPTAGSKSRIMTRDQEDSLRREMAELLETEKNYVRRLHELWNSDAASCAWNQAPNPNGYTASGDKFMQMLFPQSLGAIVSINTEFFDSMTALMGNGLEEQIPIELNAFAKLLLRFFPLFKSSYQDYLGVSSNFPRLLSDLLREGPSHHARLLQQAGEQRLRSGLIEPVQRLPRYSLFIDNMVNQLPADHSAIPKFLRAKDIVTDICALEHNSAADSKRMTGSLRSLVADWPSDLVPEGRLITAADAVELQPPFSVKNAAKGQAQCLLLLFTDCIVVAQKLPGDSLSARGFLAEIDRPLPSANIPQADSHFGAQQRLKYNHSYHLQESDLMESDDGMSIYISYYHRPPNSTTSKWGNDASVTPRVYALLGSYEGKVARLSEEVAKARVEHRFPEKMREDDGWSLRVLNPGTETLGVVTATFEDDSKAQNSFKRKAFSRTRILISALHQADQGDFEGEKDPYFDVVGRILVGDAQAVHLELKIPGESSTLEQVNIDNFASVFSKKLSNLHRRLHQPCTLRKAQGFVSRNQRIARSLEPSLPSQHSQTRRRFHPISPVKAISSFLGGMSREQSSYARLPQPGSNIIMPRPGEFVSSTRSLPRVPDPLPSPSKLVKSKQTEIQPVSNPTENTFSQLENTLSTYVIALHSRCGNIVGKVIRNRTNADILAVNELYNALLEDPNQVQSTAEVPIDVLFSAFEKFLNQEWKDRIGPILPSAISEKMQILFSSVSSRAIQDLFRNLLNEMKPQNRRAFSALLKLLYELLDASGNDGDRGILTAAFAEIMVQDANPHDYIPVLDRLIEDIDVFFDDINVPDTATASKNDSLQGTKTTNTGSLGSTASSLKKRFGFGTLSRENSAKESESRVGQILRNLSKKASTEANSQPSSLSKSFLARSRSTDNENRRPLLPRPGSKETDQAPSHFGHAPNTCPQLGSPTLPSSPQSRNTLYETPRKKRRSSLSDLPALRNSPIPDFASPRGTRRIESPADAVSPFQTARKALRTPSPPKMQRTIGDQSSKIPSPTNLKENVPPTILNMAHESPSKSIAAGTLGSGFSPRKREVGPSQIHTTKLGMLSPPTRGSSVSKPSSPQKLRIQSPQKLRERLDRERKAIEEAGPSLKFEMSKIGDELSGVKTLRYAHGLQSRESTPRIGALENRVTSMLDELAKRTSSIQADIESSLAVSEKKAKSLDELYREANAENELLYERFNTELGRVLKAVKEGQGIQEMSTKLKQSQDEAARLRKENQRLKRENLGLRSQLKGP